MTGAPVECAFVARLRDLLDGDDREPHETVMTWLDELPPRDQTYDYQKIAVTALLESSRWAMTLASSHPTPKDERFTQAVLWAGVAYLMDRLLEHGGLSS